MNLSAHRAPRTARVLPASQPRDRPLPRRAALRRSVGRPDPTRPDPTRPDPTSSHRSTHRYLIHRSIDRYTDTSIHYTDRSVYQCTTNSIDRRVITREYTHPEGRVGSGRYPSTHRFERRAWTSDDEATRRDATERAFLTNERTDGRTDDGGRSCRRRRPRRDARRRKRWNTR